MSENNNGNYTITNFFYDLNGNQIRKEKAGLEKWDYLYDFENRLTEVKKNGLTVQKNFYDGDGKRIKKEESGETTVYIYMGIQVIYEKTIETGKTVKNVSGVARIEKLGETETISYLHSDHLGSLRGVTDSSGNLQTTMTYDPFGEVRSGSSNGIRYTYTGKEQDATGLYYYFSRYYDPTIGRFITKDSFSGQIGDPQTQNRYSYVLNNPLKYIDPTGHDPPFDWEDFYERILAGLFTPSDSGWGDFGSGFDAYCDSKINDLLKKGDPQSQAKAAGYMFLRTHHKLIGEFNPENIHRNLDFELAKAGIEAFYYDTKNHGKLYININPNEKLGKYTYGTTQMIHTSLGGEGELTVTLYQGAFKSYEALYHIAGHEFIHVEQYWTKTNIGDERQAYMWNYAQSFSVTYPFNMEYILKFLFPGGIPQ